MADMGSTSLYEVFKQEGEICMNIYHVFCVRIKTNNQITNIK